MQESSIGSAGSWNGVGQHVSRRRQTGGRLLIAGATLVLLGLVLLQAMHTFGSREAGWNTWRPILYAYVLWAAAIGAGLVLVRGERGHRALFILPAVLFTFSMVLFPTIFGLYIALTNWNLSATAGRQWAGLDNFRALFSDSYFWHAMLNMLYYVLAVLAQYAIAFGLALLLNAEIRGRKFFRVAFLLPFMLSPVAVSWMIGKSILDLRFGPASTLARHLGWQTPAFFASPWSARLSIMAMDAWYSIPFMMVLLLAGLQALPGEVLESARVDGASPWQSFWQMVYPIMLPVSVTAVVLRIIFELKLADIVINVTGGAPGGATDTVTSFIFREYRDRSNVGYGTALAQFYLIMIVVFITFLLSLVGRWLRKVA